MRKNSFYHHLATIHAFLRTHLSISSNIMANSTTTITVSDESDKTLHTFIAESVCALSGAAEQESIPVTLSAYKEIITEFLHQADFKLPTFVQDDAFEQEVIDLCLAQELPAKQMEVIAKLGAATAKFFYPKHPRELQLELGKFTALAFTIDDLGYMFPEALRTYRTRLVTGQPMDAKIMRSLLTQAHELSQQYYDTFDGDMIVKAVLEFFSSNLVEIERGHKLCPNENSPNFTNYFRLKSGVAEPFSYFIFPSVRSRHLGDCAHLPIIPDLMAFMDDVNDLMSFYKESMVGDERDNAIYMHAKARGQGLTQALLDYRDTSLKLIGRIRAFAAGTNEESGLQDQVDEFLNGYMAFHLTYPRYRLSELSLSHAGTASGI